MWTSLSVKLLGGELWFPNRFKMLQAKPHPINGKTNLVGLIGEPVSHSISPVIHNAAFEEMGLDWKYVAMPCKKEHLEAVIQSLRLINFKGLNITIPHKQKVLSLCSKLDNSAKEAEAINTMIPIKSNEWIGSNTDIEGFISPLLNYKLKGKSAIIIGCGGSARAILIGLKKINLGNITVIGRDKNKLNNFKDFSDRIFKNQSQIVQIINEDHRDLVDFIKTSNLIINATPVGMSNKRNEEKHLNRIPLGEKVWSHLQSNSILYDLIYRPRPTEWLLIGKKNGNIIIDGLEMLINQGALSLKMWTSYSTIPISTMRKAAEDFLLSNF